MATPLFGWDLLIRSVEAEIKCNEDILLCFTHLVLISNGFKCIGLGESKTMDGTESKTETLPKGWNEAYTIRYVCQGRLYILKATKLGDGLMLNLIRVDERTASSVQLNSSSVNRRSGSLDQVLPNHSDMLNMIKLQLIDKVVVSTKSREASCQTPATQRQTRSSEMPPRPSPFNDPLMVGHPPIPIRPYGVGELDLDPLGGNRNPLGVPMNPGGGGGMLFEPPRYPQGPSRGLPPGAVPPGARFDPFRPPPEPDRFPPRRRNVPDNDELPPPGYDDMFM